jgi:chromosome segregation ATPase
MSLLGKVVGTLTLGIVREVEENEPAASPPSGSSSDIPPHDQPAARAAPVEPSPNATNPAKIAARTKKDLETVLGKTPQKFQDFLLKQHEFLETLLEANVEQSKAEGISISKAIKATHLSVGDVSEAAMAAKSALGEIRSSFSGIIDAERQEKITDPKSQIAERQAEIERLRGEIATLENRIRELNEGIGPVEAGIATAEGLIANAEANFKASCAGVETALQALEAAILAGLKQNS